MNSTENELTVLNQQLEELTIQISFMTVKHQTAAEIALKFAQELDRLKTEHQHMSLTLRDLQLHQSGEYMWENIGDGG